MDNLIESVGARARIPERRTDATDVVIPEIGPLVSQEQLEQCESSLGFRLPELLRRLYLQVGNGGFGPGYGLFPIPGGEAKGPNILSQYEACRKPPYSATWKWPTGLLMICDWGCEIRSCVDATSPQIKVFTSSEYGVHHSRWTLETWLSDWASNVDLWEVMTETDLGFAPHPETGEAMEFS
ncbi:MAG: SMI1/KNR4 family protein [Fimbriiglobus sp.]